MFCIVLQSAGTQQGDNTSKKKIKLLLDLRYEVSNLKTIVLEILHKMNSNERNQSNSKIEDPFPVQEKLPKKNVIELQALEENLKNSKKTRDWMVRE